jgi:putative iron-regulated protein
MRRWVSRITIAALLIGCVSSCHRPPAEDSRRPVVSAYADLVLATYEDTASALRTLDQAVDKLLAEPSEQTLSEARESWRAARVPYSYSEAFRFYGGPIDGTNGPEGQINGWPLDENHIDAVRPGYNAAPGLNIIGNPTGFPQITPEVVAAQNEAGGEKNIASGYHAIEFLLWGQDLNSPPESAGQRPYTDFVSNGDANSVNARRGQYLKAALQLLMRDIDGLVPQWRAPPAGTENYRSRLVSGDVYTGLKRMFTGAAALSEVEMAGERMSVSLLSGDQEEEQSCFSDNSMRDLRANAAGIEHVYFGSYQRLDGSVVSGPSLAKLVRAADARVADEMEQRIARTRTALAAVGDPFDREIQSDNEAGRARVQAAIDALRAESLQFFDAAKALQIFLSSLEGVGD